MHVPPHPLLLPLYPVTGGLCLLAVGATLSGWLFKVDVTPLTSPGDLWTVEPWRLATCWLLHGGPLHLLFNVIWLWTLGTAVEEELGHGKAAGVAVLTGLTASVASQAVDYSAVGLSGLLYGVFGFLWMAGRPATSPFHHVVDGRTVGLMLAWAVLCVLLTQSGAMRIANTAHFAGLASGVVLGLAYASQAPLRWALAFVAVAVMPAAATWAALRGPWRGTAMRQARQVAAEAQDALDRERWRPAEELFDLAIRLGEPTAAWHHNRGVARFEQGRFAEAAEDFARAAELAPANPVHREAEASARARLPAGR